VKCKSGKALNLLFPLMLVASAQASLSPVYTEVSASSGIVFQSESNPMAGGIAWIDFNNDGDPDLYVPSGSGPNRLYQNLGNGTFSEIAAQAGATLGSKTSLGVAIGDYNGDGNDDIFVVNQGVNSLLRNNSDGTFTDVTVGSGLDDSSKRSFAASFGDIDNDGDLDIYVGHWDFQTQPDLHCPDNDLYLNNGDGTFTNVSVESGTNSPGCAFSVPLTDFDQDGDLDIFLPNDNVGWGSQTPTLDNEMLRNDGPNANGVPVFTSVGDLIGVGQSLTGMGAAIGDIDNDGDIDFYRTQIGSGILSINDGTNNNTSQGDSDGGTGWGAAFFDANNDGFIDLYRGNSGSGFSGQGQANTFWLNNGDGTFTQMAASVGLTSINAGLGLAYADYDNDGDMDVVVHGQNGDVNLFRNDTPAQNFADIELKGLAGNHRGIGARVFISSTDGSGTLKQMQEIHAGSSHGSSNDPGVHFGLAGQTAINYVKVIWPDGCLQKVSSITVNQSNLIDQSLCSDEHTISGTILDQNGVPVSGVAVQVNDNFGFASTVFTDVNGVYTQTVPNGLYIAYPMATSDYTFATTDGSSIFVRVEGEDEVKDYTAVPRTYEISGTILDQSGNPVPGVAVQVNDNFGFASTVYTDVNGVYRQTVTNGLYIAYPSSSSYTFSTTDGSSIFVQVDGANEVKDYVAVPKTYTISGTILDQAGSPVVNVPVQVNDNFGFASTVYTNASGVYIQTVPNGLYIAYPSSSSYTFSTTDGSSIFVQVDGANEVKDYIAVPK